MCPPMWAHWHHPANTTEIMLIRATWRIPLNLCFLRPTQVQIDQFSHFCTAHGRKSLYFAVGASFPKNFPLSWGICNPSNSWFLGPVQARSPNGITIGSAVFAQVTAECPYTLQWAALLPPQNYPWGILTHIYTWFPGLTRVLNPNSILIGSAIFAGLTSVTDRPTDRQTSLLGR